LLHGDDDDDDDETEHVPFSHIRQLQRTPIIIFLLRKPQLFFPKIVISIILIAICIASV
jgi:hypothetical protein